LDNVLFILLQKNMVTSEQMPHFYQNLPRRTTDYGDDFTHQPLLFHSSLKDIKTGDRVTLEVLLNRNNRITVKSCESPRVFANIWKPSQAVILKGEAIAPELYPILIFHPEENGLLEAAGHIRVQSNDLYLSNNGEVKGTGDWNFLIEQVARMEDDDLLIDLQPPVRPASRVIMLMLKRGEPETPTRNRGP